MKTVLITLLVLGGMSFSAFAEDTSGDSLIVGTWQTPENAGITKYRAFYRDSYGKLRSVFCKSSRDIDGNSTSVVVCSTESKGASFLEYNASENVFRFTSSGEVFNRIRSDGHSFIQTGLFAFVAEEWIRSAPETEFVFVK